MNIWVINALLSAIFASLVAIFGKIGLQNIDSTLATTVRAIIMALFLIIVSLAFGKIKFISSLDSKSLYFIALSGIAGALSWIFYFIAIKYGPPPAVAALDRLSVVFVLIFAIIFLGQEITIKSSLGAILVTIGAVLMSI